MERFHLPDVLQFHPRWWVDPVPPWLFQHLDREQVIELTRIKLEQHVKVLEAHLTETQAQLDATRQTLEKLR
jgi:hypothetical protein